MNVLLPHIVIENATSGAFLSYLHVIYKEFRMEDSLCQCRGDQEAGLSAQRSLMVSRIDRAKCEMRLYSEVTAKTDWESPLLGRFQLSAKRREDP